MKKDENGNLLVKEFGERSLSQNDTFGAFVVPSTVTKLGDWALYFSSLTSLKVHSGVTEIGGNCFSYCRSLKTAEIDTVNLTSNSSSLFESDFNLASVELADVSLLPKSLFSGCSSLKEIVIPETVTNIGETCFSGCTSLGDITCLPSKAPSLGSNVFGDRSNNYTGINATTKILTVPSNATGYDSGD